MYREEISLASVTIRFHSLTSETLTQSVVNIVFCWCWDEYKASFYISWFYNKCDHMTQLTLTWKPNRKSPSMFLKFFLDFCLSTLWCFICCCSSNCFHLPTTGGLPTLHVSSAIFTSVLALRKMTFQVRFPQAPSHFGSHRINEFSFTFFLPCLLITY